jgi:hypothetical protein
MCVRQISICFACMRSKFPRVRHVHQPTWIDTVVTTYGRSNRPEACSGAAVGVQDKHESARLDPPTHAVGPWRRAAIIPPGPWYRAKAKPGAIYRLPRATSVRYRFQIARCVNLAPQLTHPKKKGLSNLHSVVFQFVHSCFFCCPIRFCYVVSYSLAWRCSFIAVFAVAKWT